MSNVKCTMQLFHEGYSCSRAIRNVYLDPLGVSEAVTKELVQRFAQSLDSRPLCGAVTGAFAVLAQRHLSAFTNPAQKQEEVHALFTVFARRFCECHTHLTCFDLLGCDIGSEEGMKQVQEQQLCKNKCVNLVKDAATILEDMLFYNPAVPN